MTATMPRRVAPKAALAAHLMVAPGKSVRSRRCPGIKELIRESLSVSRATHRVAHNAEGARLTLSNREGHSLTRGCGG